MPSISINQISYETDLVIFDKDGTLLDFQASWLGIIAALIEAIGRRTPMSAALSSRIQRYLGIDLAGEEIHGFGPLAMGTDVETEIILAGCLYREGLRWDQASAVVRAACDEVFGGQVRLDHMTAAKGALELLKNLKQRGILTAVATNDNAIDAGRDMRAIGAADLIDFVAGADSVKHAKPAPDMIELICSKLNVEPRRAVMIGDAVSDTSAGRQAGCGLTVGIAGFVPDDILRQHCDVLVRGLYEIS